MIPRNYRIHIVLMLAAAAMIIFPLISQKVPEEKAGQATAAAERFLDLVDQEKYGESWDMSASLMKEKISREKWVEHLGKAMQLTGPAVGRQQEDLTYSTMAKDSPDGEYIVINYNSSFKNQADLGETITVMLDKDGRWRVAGYFVQ